MIGSNTDLSLVLDPGGIEGVREGINLRVYPSGDSIGNFQPVGIQAERLANGSLSSGGFGNLYEFSTSFYLTGEDFDKLYSLLAYNQNARELGQPWEIVIYNLVRPFTEISSSRTRFMVPGTSVIREVSMGNGLTSFTYWVALQGAMVANWVQQGEYFEVAMSFQEGTKLGSEIEVM